MPLIQARAALFLHLVLIASFTSACSFLGIGFGRGTVVEPDQGPWVPGTPVLRFAVLGDAEPKPDPIFDQWSDAIDETNRMASERRIDFVASVGDIAHRGKVEQYDAATAEIERLSVPFYAIMGNEEYEGGVDRFLQYAQTWNSEITGIRYVVQHAGVVFIFVTADRDGEEFTDEGISWLSAQVKKHRDSPVIIFTHAPVAGIFPATDAGIKHPGFKGILAHENVVALFSGHLHLNLDYETSYVIRDDVLHVHVPGVERTKRPNEQHVPRFRFVTIHDNGAMEIETFNIETRDWEPEHRIRFMLRFGISQVDNGS